MPRFILLSIVTFACTAGERAEALELFDWLRGGPVSEPVIHLPVRATGIWYDAPASYAGEVIFDEGGTRGYGACCDECGDCSCGTGLHCCCRRMLARARRCCRRLLHCCLPEPTCCEPEPSCCEPVDCCPKRRCRLFGRVRFRPDCCPYCADEVGSLAMESWSDVEAVDVYGPRSDEAAESFQRPADRAPTPLMEISI